MLTLAAITGSAVLAANLARADHAPYELPNGVIVHEDWGLYRPGAGTPWIEGPYVVGPPRYVGGSAYGPTPYYPSNRNDPGAYRSRPRVPGPLVPPRPYFRSWGAGSPRADATDATVYAPFAPPEVIYAPRIDGRRGHPNRR